MRSRVNTHKHSANEAHNKLIVQTGIVNLQLNQKEQFQKYTRQVVPLTNQYPESNPTYSTDTNISTFITN